MQEAPQSAGRMTRVLNWLRYPALGIVFFWFMLGGIAHFTSTDFFVSIMPPYVPFHRPVVYLTGVLEILLAIGILVPLTRERAGLLLVLLTIAVTPANVHMWLHPDLYPGSTETALTLRLVFQVVLIGLIWWSTRRPAVPGAAAS